MARTSTKTKALDSTSIDSTVVKTIEKTANEAAAHSTQIMAAFGEGLPYDQSRIVHEARFYMSTSAEAMLEAGKRLVILKEHEPHGEFVQILENQLGMESRIAQKMMQASIKFLNPRLESKAKSISHLGKTKLYDLMLLDDESIESLADGGTVAGIDLDDIERMSSRELRMALREQREQIAAKDKVIADKNKKIDKTSEQLKRLKKLPPDEDAAQYRKEASEFADEVERLIRVQLADSFTNVQVHGEETAIDETDYLVSRLQLLDKALTELYGRLGIERNATPGAEWEGE